MRYKDFELIEEARLGKVQKITAKETVAALHYLKLLGAQYDMPVEQITVEQIVQSLSNADSAMKNHRTWVENS